MNVSTHQVVEAQILFKDEMTSLGDVEPQMGPAEERFKVSTVEIQDLNREGVAFVKHGFVFVADAFADA